MTVLMQSVEEWYKQVGVHRMFAACLCLAYGITAAHSHAQHNVFGCVYDYVGSAVQLPIVTRSYVTFSFLTTAGCALEVGCGHYTAPYLSFL
jgi:hypothetical protein